MRGKSDGLGFLNFVWSIRGIHGMLKRRYFVVNSNVLEQLAAVIQAEVETECSIIPARSNEWRAIDHC